jgi:hypothetical protein
LREKDVTEIIEVLENELHRAPRLDKIEKMRMKTKIRHQASWLSLALNPTPKKLFDKLRSRLSDVFFLFPYAFSDNFKEFLDEKITNSVSNH